MLSYYWHQVEGNVLAVPLCAVVAAVLAAPVYFLRDHIGRRLARWWHRHWHAAHEDSQGERLG